MRFLLLSTALAGLVGLAVPAAAADLIIDEPAEVGVMDVSGSWDGAYIGVFAGYGRGTADDVNDWYGFFDDDYGIELSGWMLGVTAGANFTVGNGIVAGIVGDLAWANLSGESYSYYESYYASFDVNWTGSLRGRLGFDGGSFLPYLTAGLAVANGTFTVDDNSSWSDTQTHLGWTVGAGVEFAVTDNLSVDLLYRYSDYGSAEYDNYYDGSEFGLTTHTIQAGLNWSF